MTRFAVSFVARRMRKTKVNAQLFEIDHNVPPVKLPKRRVPVAMMEPLKEELKDMEKREIIAPVEQSTDWISSMVSVSKQNGKLRICIDPKPLNRALKRSHFPLPTIDDVLPELENAKVFTVYDVKHGFWHIKLEEESSYLTTFSTPFGRYRWLRMPMGISPAPEVFQRKLTHESAVKTAKTAHAKNCSCWTGSISSHTGSSQHTKSRS